MSWYMRDVQNIQSALDSIRGVVSPLQAQLDAKAAASHTHDALTPLAGTLFVNGNILTQSLTASALTALGGGSSISFTWPSVASFPAAATRDGCLAHAEDSGKIFYAHGGNWIEIPAESANLTPSRALVSDAYGKITSAAATSAELGYLVGANSGIQAQLDAKANVAGEVVFSGTVVSPSFVASHATPASTLVIEPARDVSEYMTRHTLRWKSGQQATFINNFTDAIVYGVDDGGAHYSYSGIQTAHPRELSVWPHPSGTASGIPLLRQGWAGTVAWGVRKSRKPSPTTTEDTLLLQTSLDGGRTWQTVLTYRPTGATNEDYSAQHAFARLTQDVHVRLVVNSADVGAGTYIKLYSITMTPDPMAYAAVAQAAANKGVPLTLYVAPFGNDGSLGTTDQPLQTLAAAVARGRAVRAGTGRTVDIVLRDGQYTLGAGGLQLTALDSGTSIRAHPEETPVVRQGISLSPSLFVPLDPIAHEFVYAAIDPSVRASVRVASLAGTGVQVADGKWGYTVPNTIKRSRLFVDGVACSLARYPKAGTPSSTWPRVSSVVADGAGGVTGGIFAYTADFTRPSQWSASADVWVTGIFSEPWEVLHNTAVFDAGTKRVTFLSGHPRPLFATGSTVRRQWFYAENIPEEMREPGEYYVDPGRNLLFLIPPPGFDDARDISMWTAQTAGVSVVDATDIAFAGIEFRYFAGTAVSVLGGANVSFDECTFACSVSVGLSVRSAGCTARDCRFKDLGGSGAVLSGGSLGNDIFPGNNVVDTCVFDDCGLYNGAYGATVALAGVNNTVTRSSFLRGLGNFINISSGYGLEISENTFYSCLNDYYDMGYIYTNTSSDPRHTANIIRGNYFDGKGYGIETSDGVHFVYLDNGTSGWQVTDNTFYAALGSAVYINGGGWVDVSNNAFLECAHPLAFELVFASPIPAWAQPLFDAIAAQWTAIWTATLSLPGFAASELARRHPWLATLLQGTTVASVFDHRTNAFTDNVVLNARTPLLAVIKEGPDGTKSEATKLAVQGTIVTEDRVLAKAATLRQWRDPALPASERAWHDIGILEADTVRVTGKVDAAEVLAKTVATDVVVASFVDVATSRALHTITSINEQVGGLVVENGELVVTQGSNPSGAPTFGICDLEIVPYKHQPVLPVGWTGTISVAVDKTVYNFYPGTASTINDYVRLFFSTDRVNWGTHLAQTTYYDPALGDATPVGSGVQSQNLTYVHATPLVAPTYVRVYCRAYPLGAGTTIRFGRLAITGIPLRAFSVADTSMARTSFIAALQIPSTTATAAAPALTLADGTSGFFRPSANVIALATASDERIRVTATGNVGIGVTTPAATLHVAGSAKVDGNVSVNLITTGTGTVAAPSLTFVGQTASGLFSPAANTVSVATAGVERLRVGATGDVTLSGNLSVANVFVANVTVRPVELSHLSGVTAAIQTQLNAKAALARVAAVTSWTSRASAIAADWGAFAGSVAYSPKFRTFAAVSSGGIMTSGDGGVTWQTRTSPSVSGWTSICSSDDTFVAVAGSGASRAMKSTDGGATWTAYPGVTADWRCVTYSEALGMYVAVSPNATPYFAMSSEDAGVTWTTRSGVAAMGVVWAPGLAKFVTGAYLGVTGYSGNGIVWTSTPFVHADVVTRAVAWSTALAMVVSVASAGTSAVATTANGIDWTTRTAPIRNWQSVKFSEELGVFVAVADSGAGRVMWSADGISWTTQTSAVEGNGWRAVAWSPDHGVFCAVANTGASLGDRVMTSRAPPPVAAQVGTSAAPALTFGTGAGTGLFSPAANTVSVATAGVERLRVGPTGSVEIPGGLSIAPGPSFAPTANGQLTFEFTNATTLTIRGRDGSGVVRSAVLTLA